MTDFKPLPTRQYLPPRHLLPAGDAVTEAWDFAKWAIERAESGVLPTNHVDAVRSIVALADLCREDKEFAAGKAARWLHDTNQLAAWLEVKDSKQQDAGE